MHAVVFSSGIGVADRAGIGPRVWTTEAGRGLGRCTEFLPYSNENPHSGDLLPSVQATSSWRLRPIQARQDAVQHTVKTRGREMDPQRANQSDENLPSALRLTFTYSGDNVRLTSVHRVAMLAPAGEARRYVSGQ